MAPSSTPDYPSYFTVYCNINILMYLNNIQLKKYIKITGSVRIKKINDITVKLTEVL